MIAVGIELKTRLYLLITLKTSQIHTTPIRSSVQTEQCLFPSLSCFCVYLSCEPASRSNNVSCLHTDWTGVCHVNVSLTQVNHTFQTNQCIIFTQNPYKKSKFALHSFISKHNDYATDQPALY